MDIDALVYNKNRDDTDGAVEAPEAVALLSFGLLLRLAHLSRHRSATSISIAEASQWWENAAMECVSYANDECGAFSYLHEVMMALLPLNRFVQGDGFDQDQRDTVKGDTYGWPDDEEHQMLHANGDGSDFDINIEEADDAAA
eukprot:11936826-Ditylum_brightwellii.AAC.1